MTNIYPIDDDVICNEIIFQTPLLWYFYLGWLCNHVPVFDESLQRRSGRENRGARVYWESLSNE